KYFRIERDRARESRPLLHPAADLARIVALEALEPDQSQLQRGDVANLRLRQIGKFAERQSDVFRQRHRAPQRAALIQHAEMPQHLLALLGLALGEIEIPVPDFALGRLDQSQHVAEQGAFAAAAAAHDYEDVAMIYGEVYILHHHEGS